MSVPDGHALVLAFRDEAVQVEPVCRAGADADCRAHPRNGCRCEDYTILRTGDGAPYHRVDTFGGAEVLHWMTPGGPCTVVEWLQDDPLAFMRAGVQAHIAEVPVAVRVTEHGTPEWAPGRRRTGR